MADARVLDILSKVRLNLKQIDIENLQNEEIFRKGKRIVRDLLRELKPVEKEFIIVTVIDQEAYDFADEKTLDIILVKTSWTDYDLYIVDNNWFQGVTTSGATYPKYMTIFNSKAYLRPFPASAGDIITVWAYQTDAILNIDNNTPPETPEYLDEAIILGICSQYNKNEFQLDYETEKGRWKGEVHRKHSQPKIKHSNW